MSLVRGVYLTKRERERVCYRAINALESMKWAAFWVHVYRDKLYRDSHHGRAIEEKMNDRKDVAQKRAWRIADLYGVDRLSEFSGLRRGYGRALEWHTPTWSKVPDVIQARACRAGERARWWMLQQRQYAHLPEHNGQFSEVATRWHEHWEFVRDAVEYLRLRSWPLSERDIARTLEYRQNERDNEVLGRIRAEVWREEQQAEAAKAAKRRKVEVKREAQEMLAEIVPGAKTRRLMSKAHGFDALIKLLEGSHVDDKTKDAIVRLREAVEGERPASRRLPSSPASAADISNRRRDSERGDDGLPTPDG